MNPLKRILRAVLRLTAGIAVIAIIAGPVAVMAMVAGNPFGGDLLEALQSRDIDNHQIIKLMSLAFYVLWAWFSIPAVRQTAISLSAPRATTRARLATPTPTRVTRPAAALPADEPGPRGWLARLVRFALGAATVATTMTSVATGWVPPVSAAPPPVTSVVDDVGNPHVAPTPPADHDTAAPDERVSHVTAERRDTAYSIARRLFPNNTDNARDEILDLNTGRLTPSGATWSGGNFPVGMNVVTPYFATATETDTEVSAAMDGSAPATYQVKANDGWINVVEGLWGSDAGQRWRQLRLELVGQHVAPGIMFTADTTTIHPGWVFTRPAEPTPASTPSVETSHVVERGDTLYEIVDDVVDEPVTGDHIDAVAHHNDGMVTPDGVHVFSAAKPDLIHPGQVVDLTPVLDTEPVDGPAPADTVTEPAPVDEPAATPADAGDQSDAATDDPADQVDDQPADDAAPTDADAPSGRDVDESRPGGPIAAPADTGSTRAPAPVITSPAPPVPVPTNAVTATPAQPGDSAATPPVIDTAPADTDGSTPSTAPFALLAAGGLGLAGLFLALDRRRRKARAKRPAGTSIAAPDPVDTETEHVMRSAAHVDRATRVNLAVRHLGRQLAERDAPLRAHYLLATADTVTAVFDQPVDLVDGWVADPANDNGWICTLDDDQLELFDDDPAPWPALVPIGTLDDGTDLLVDVEGLGSLAVTGPDHVVDRFLAAIVTAISSSPYADLLTFVDDHNIALHGLEQHLQHRLAVDSIDSLIDRLGNWIAPFDFDDQHLLAARHELGAEYEPCIAALVTTLDDAQRSKLADLPLDGSHPIALLTTDINLAGTVLDLDDDGTTVIDGHRVHCHRLEPVTATAAATLFDVVDTPTVVDTTPLDELDRLTQSIPTESPEADEPDIDEPDIDEPAGDAAPAVAPAIAVANAMLPPIPGQLFDTDPDVDWTIRVLGPLEIVHHDGTHLNGPKMRELATLIAMHPAGVPTAELSRMLGGTPKAALASRVSELRRLLGHGDGETGRTYLPANNGARGYHLEGVHVDSVRLARCLDQARSAHGQDKINWLVGALELVRGQLGVTEFTSFGWAGHLMNTLEASITDAGVELVTLAAEHEQWQIVDWAANQVRLANPYEQRVFPVQIEARRAMGDEVGIRRLHDEALDDVDEFEPDVAAAFHEALARRAH